MRRLRNLLFVMLGTFLIASIGFSAEKSSFSTKLSGDASVPKVTTAAKGHAKFTLSTDGTGLSYKVSVTDLANVTAAHIHKGKKGENGPPIAGLFAGPKKEGKFSGVLAEGVITEKDLMGSFSGKPLSDLIKLIKSGGAYVNVHTDAHPDGEIRGQIK